MSYVESFVVCDGCLSSMRGAQAKREGAFCETTGDVGQFASLRYQTMHVTKPGRNTYWICARLNLQYQDNGFSEMEICLEEVARACSVRKQWFAY